MAACSIVTAEEENRMSKLEERVAELEVRLNDLADREAIRELTSDYCQRVQGGDVEGVVALFCEDGSIFAEMTPKPFIHNHVIELDGGSARGVCSVEIRLVQDGRAYDAAGHYHDDYRKIAGRWRFQRRVFVVYHWCPTTEGWV
jgi:ketosteroid isomerase-like protein